DMAEGGDWWNHPQDRNAHGGIPFVVWYLQQMGVYEQQHGLRLLDYLDLHYYPQAQGVALAPAGGSDTQALRLRSTRSLWDPNYADESWIANTDDGPAVRLLPRMREWVEANYPGTKLALTEYNWGALDHINGALAQADVLGIFGRERLDLATLWDPPQAGQPGAFAFRIYRNYDGAGSAFGETSVYARSGEQERLAIYGAQRANDQALTLVVINKATTSLTSTVTISGVIPGPAAEVYRYSEADLSAIQRLAERPISGGSFTDLYPAGSITLLVIPPVATSPCPSCTIRLPAIWNGKP
ncbi:MAG TPA: glycoside hydrolase family 44 protein, partial [Caldilineaceae bacterium]|nr:glycoside hydrolase family 44 protein [Caldilineaceae bacterium]